MAEGNVEGGLWRPADMDEATRFEFAWCKHCANKSGAGDWEDEFGNEVEGSCPISDAMFWAPQHRPADLVVRNGEPHCTAFAEDPERPMRCPFTLELNL